MPTRLDVISGKVLGDGKTFWTRIGSAWTKDDGPGFTLILDALPVPVKNPKTGEYEVRLVGVVPKGDYAKRDDDPQAKGREKRQNDASGPIDDDIPF